MKTLPILAVALALSACANAPVASPASPPDGDQQAFRPCKVEEYQAYVGRQRSEIPAAPAGAIFRVLCTTCPATMDYRENRVSFAYDEASGVVERVSCG